MLGSFEEAEDLVQETLLRAWRRRETLERDEWFRAWLYKIATNACLDKIKSDKPPGAVARVVPRRPVAPALPGPAARRGDRSPRETIELTFLAVIQLLPPRQRAVLIMRDVLEWAAEQVAELLELSVAAVNSALQRARRRSATTAGGATRGLGARARRARPSASCSRASSTPTSAATPRRRSR